MAMDVFGGVMCTLSLAFRSSFDALAGASYLVVVACDCTIVLLYFILKERGVVHGGSGGGKSDDDEESGEDAIALHQLTCSD